MDIIEVQQQSHTQKTSAGTQASLELVDNVHYFDNGNKIK
jgi:hypothetical protein